MHYTKTSFFIFLLSTLVMVGCGKKADVVGSFPQPKTSSTESNGSVKLKWDGSFSSPGVLDVSVTGYRIHWGTATRDYSETQDVGLAYKTIINDLPKTKVFFAVTAYNAQGLESEYSDEVWVDFATNTVSSAGEVEIYK